jgi:TonB family protein
MMPIAWKATAILVAACCAATCLRSRSASLRHFIWTAALAALLFLLVPLPVVGDGHTLPAQVLNIPALDVAVPAGRGTAPQTPWLMILYITGTVLAAARFLIGAFRTSWIVRRASPSSLGEELGVPVVSSADAPMPLAWGIFRPVIVLPEVALGWPDARLRAVLLHESMHHRRRDLLTQAIAQVACCLFWCHPLAWFALARQRRERERACDDAVLQQGIAAQEYATHLIDVVRAVAADRRGWSDAPAMADASSLETRVRAVLDRDIDRRAVTRPAACAIVFAALLALITASSVSLHAQTARGAITGVVQDPSGARVPNCRITAKNLDGANEEVGVADAAGEFRFTGIPVGHYLLEFRSPGFAISKVNAEVVTGATAQVAGRLAVGQTTESVTVNGKRSTSFVAPQLTRAAERIRVGGSVTPVRLLVQTRPVYPADLQQLGLEGTVVIRAIISKAGAVMNPQVVNSADPRLAKAALDAVSQWQYQPSLLNGEPIETLTSISVDFHLEP